MITMVHNTNSNRKKRKNKKIKIKKYEGQKNTDLILLHQATHNSCIIDIISCISNIGTHLSPFLLASLVKKAVIYAYWTKELFDICRENVSLMATLPSVARHVIYADNLRPRH